MVETAYLYCRCSSLLVMLLALPSTLSGVVSQCDAFGGS